jgi:hypothetical protein
MVKQTIFNFKLEISEEKLTSHAGLTLAAECAEAIGLSEAFEAELPAAGSNRGYSPWEYGRAVVLMLSGGGRALDDLRELGSDRGLRESIELTVPSADATGDWLRRTGAADGERQMNRINRRALKKILSRGKRKRYTLDIDATFIESHKREAKYSYHNEPGYYPMTGWLAEEELCLGYEFREGNESPSADNLQFIKFCERQLPKGKRIGMVRSDSAAYNSMVIGYCQRSKMRFVIAADKDAAVLASIKALPKSAWRDLPTDLGVGQYAETTHAFNNQKVDAFRLIVIRRPYQLKFFDENGEEQREESERYFAYATDLECDAADAIRTYNDRGQCENLIKELKIGYGMEYLPCGDFEANAVWFGLGVIAYNLGQALKFMALGCEWVRRQVVTLRWRIYNTAGKLISHAGQSILKISGGVEKLELFNMVRRKLFEEYATV